MLITRLCSGGREFTKFAVNGILPSPVLININQKKQLKAK